MPRVRNEQLSNGCLQSSAVEPASCDARCRYRRFVADGVMIMSAASPTSTRTHSRNVARAPWPHVRCAVAHWSSDQAATIGAALAFYCAFSIAPLLVILLHVSGWIVGAEAAYGQLNSQLTAL